jgi:hypothetical protein
VATKSGSQSFHGGGYYFKRHEGWNANTFTNNRQGTSRQLYRRMQTGYFLGGPVLLPGGFNDNKDKLFFFFSHEWGRSRVPNNPQRITVPTDAERRGDFSQSRDGAGRPVIIRDPNTGQPFSGNIIPPERFSPFGPAVLNWLPKPNVTGQLTHNYESQEANLDPSFDQLYRVDYNINTRNRVFVRFIRSDQGQTRPYGRGDTSNSLGLTPFFAPTFGWSITGNLTTIINPTLTNEFQLGKSKNGIPGNAPPEGSPYYRSVSGINIPLLYPNADPSGLIPNFGFGGTGGPGNATQFTRFAGSPYANANPITNVVDNISKVHGTHTLKAGIFIEHAIKTENPFRPYNANIIFDQDSANPGDTGWAFANALMGNFTRYEQFSKTILANAPYWNIEWYAQDTWRASQKLTLNYGLRFNLVPPLY